MENFKKIEPQKGMTVKEADSFWKKEFEKESDYDVSKHEKNLLEADKQFSDETHEVKGGSYRDTKKTSDGEKHEVHHTPSNDASYLERDDGPTIKMEKEDHHQTASYGNSREAREYREKQKELIDQGKFREAVQMDIDDIKSKFGDKYDEGISQMLDYVDKLEKEGKING